jgi:Cu(I)/Ag(I) efflux system membrane fusion protein/cobalt-zinc-cadmium efflux system membrane fusion protein
VLENEPGLCPICNMKLVTVEAEEGAGLKKAKKKETHLWTCPMHPQVLEKEAGICPICNMKLVPVAAKESSAPKAALKKEDKKESKIKYWQAPMDPSYISDSPGKSPMGMDLVPVYEDEGAEADSQEGVLKIDPAIVQQIGVRTEEVRMGELRNVIRTVGILDYNEKNIVWVNTKFDGWIEKVYVNYIGEKVRKGQRLFEIYSPELVSTQEEYLTARKYLEKMKEAGSSETVRQAEALMEATRRRLAYWDITEGQIERLGKTGEVVKTLTVVSPVKGRLIEKMDAALEGMYAKAGMNLYKIADLSTVWVHADIYESQLKWVRPGLETEITLTYFPGERFTGKVLFMYPFVAEKTRTMKACIEVKNPDQRLEPGMYADVRIKPVASPHALMVPEDAVLRTGKRNVVFVSLGEGRFSPREVELGVKGEGGMYEIKKGLDAGERVVVSAQFLLDSESRLQEFIRKLMAASEDEKP